jgi:2-phospho-L-lactate/phosphoenolpyruvate guanylyltransferase
MVNDRPALRSDIWAVVPVKETAFAKQRLSHDLPPALRRELALEMFEDVLEALVGVSRTERNRDCNPGSDCDGHRTTLGRTSVDGRRSRRYTGAVTAAVHRLAAVGSTLLTIPGDVPLVSPADINAVIATHPPAPAFTIVPAWDERGSNTIICSPATAVPLRFGADSFFPHLAAARSCGLTPTVIRNRAIALDIDEPPDLVKFMENGSATRSWTLLDRHKSKWNRHPRRRSDGRLSGEQAFPLLDRDE